MDRYDFKHMIAYMGKEGCSDPSCRRNIHDWENCFDWHCSVCDEPSGELGHKDCRDLLDDLPYSR